VCITAASHHWRLVRDSYRIVIEATHRAIGVYLEEWAVNGVVGVLREVAVGVRELDQAPDLIVRPLVIKPKASVVAVRRFRASYV
jgi:hypothetical protein